MDVKLRQLVSKAAGTYFVVTDKSQVAAIESESKMRLIFINVEKGQPNVLMKFAKGDTTGFLSVFGKSTRSQEKRGNFSIQTCLDALKAGPIAVVNLRAFDSNLDLAGVVGLNPNVTPVEEATPSYVSLFNRSNFWIPNAKNITSILTEQNLLNFGNVGNSDLSIFVTKAKDVTELTAEGDKSLRQMSIEVDEYPALNFDMLFKDTFVDVYVFNNNFNVGNISTNQYYGHLFDADGNVDLAKLGELAAISEAGFVRKFTGTMIPNLKSELDAEISIDTVINQYFMTVGLICHINDDLLETDNQLLFDVYGAEFFDAAGVKLAGVSDSLLSHVVPAALTKSTAVYPLTAVNQNVAPTKANLITYGCVKDLDNSFVGSFEQGIRIDTVLKGADSNYVKVVSMEVLNATEPIMIDDPQNPGTPIASGSTYTKVKYVCSGPVEFGAGDATVTVVNMFTETGLVHSNFLVSYKPREAQFVNGTADRQNEILDMMNDPGIVKGIKSTPGIRYIVDAFKSYVEANYKYQFGILVDELDQKNKFTRGILNEIFIEDFEKSVNPLFKVNPNGIFDWTYVPEGGNKTYSTKLLSKFATGESLCFAFGPGNIVNGIRKPLAGLVSNLFYNKSLAFDILANESGYVDGITELEPIDDDERAFAEKFRYNPVIYYNGGYTIFGNLSMQAKNTAQQQIHNSELLCYIKESLFNLAKSESFKKGNYDDYLRTETESKNFMESLALKGAIEPNPVVICNASNNTREIAKNKIKLVHIEYTPINGLEKVVFDLEIK